MDREMTSNCVGCNFLVTGIGAYPNGAPLPAVCPACDARRKDHAQTVAKTRAWFGPTAENHGR